MAAAERGDEAVVDALLDGEVVLSGLDNESRRGMTALTHACKANCVAAVKQLLKRGACINYGTRYDETPLDVCVLWKSVDCLAVLLERKADPDRLNRYGATPTQISLAAGNREMIELLVTAYRPSEIQEARMNALRNKPFNAAERALQANIEYSEHFYEEHDRMWGPNSGYESLI